MLTWPLLTLWPHILCRSRGTSWVQDKALPAPSFLASLQILQSSPVRGPHQQRACVNTPSFKHPSEFEVQEIRSFAYVADTGRWLTESLKPKNHFMKPSGYKWGSSGSSCSCSLPVPRMQMQHFWVTVSNYSATAKYIGSWKVRPCSVISFCRILSQECIWL